MALAFSASSLGSAMGNRVSASLGYDRLHPLRAHHRSGPVVARHVTLVPGDGREPHELLSGRTDAEDAKLPLLLTQLLCDPVLELVGVQPEEVFGVPQFGNAVMQVEVDPGWSLALQDHSVEASKLHVGTHEPVGLTGCGATGEGSPGDDAHRSSPHYRRSRERPRGDDQTVIRVVPLGFRPDLVVQDLDPDAAASYPFSKARFLPTVLTQDSGGEIHAQEPAGVTAAQASIGHYRHLASKGFLPNSPAPNCQSPSLRAPFCIPSPSGRAPL